MAEKLQQKVRAVEKIQISRKLLKEKIEQFKMEKASIQPLVGKLTEHTKFLQDKVKSSSFFLIFENNKFTKKYFILD